MTSQILLVVDKEALVPDRNRQLMRSGSLTALRKLSDHGVQLACDVPGLQPEVQRLFEQEGITALSNPDHDAFPHVTTITSGDEGSLVLNPGNAASTGPETLAGWSEVVGHLLGNYRTATRVRKTGETDISVSINLDGTGKSEISTGIPFYDHMLDQIARHGYMDIAITCRGDLEIDEHHTIEDTAITLGEAIGQALGDKRGIGRYGFVVAMDETRSLAAIDLSGRPWCEFEGEFRREKVGEFPTEMTIHFFHSFAMALKATLHVSVKGDNDHHKIEACFKALARCLRQAVDRNEKYLDILPSSKGIL